MSYGFVVEPDRSEDDKDFELPPDWEDREIEGDWDTDRDLLVWPGQDMFLHSKKSKIGLFTGAGYGKSACLIRRALKNHAEEDGWWDRCWDWKSNPLRYLFGAPQNKYLVTRLIPGFKGELNHWEMLAGRSLSSTTGRNNDGWFESASERRKEMANGMTMFFYSLHDEGSAVAADAAGVFVDEGTLLKSRNIWNRFQQRRRDPRTTHPVTAVVGTPEKGSFLYDEFFDSQDRPKPGVDVFTDSSLNNPLLTEEFFDTLQGASEAYIEAQVMGKWTKGIGGQRFASIFKEEEHLAPMNIGPHQPGVLFDIGWDPGHATGQVTIMYQSVKRKQWFIVDEIVIQGQTTADVCRKLLNMGYNKTNIRRLFMDPKDATKHKSTGPDTDADIVYKMLGVRPRVTSVPGFNAYLRTRLDALAELLKTNRIVINDKLKMRNRFARGTVNAIQNFALKTSSVDEGRFLDECTTETLKEWKHSIDSIHYVLMNYEQDVYRKVHRNDPARTRRDSKHKRKG